MNKNVYSWLRGLVAAAFGGASSIIANVAIGDEKHFGHLAKIASVAAVVSVVLYLARSPLPESNEPSN